jgi:hypothetical protein
MADFTTPNDFVAGQVAVAADVNANFTAVETFLNSTGVHVYQAGTIETAALEDSAVTSAKLASGAVTAAKRGVPDIVTYRVSSQPAIAESVTNISSGATWTQINSLGGTYTGWDAVNKRPYAKLAGVFRINASFDLSMAPTTTWDAAEATVYGFIYKNGVSVTTAPVAEMVMTKSGSSNTYEFVRHSSVVLQLAQNDYLELRASIDHLGSAAYSGFADSHTSITLEYLGPTA